jgi:hypothetical protein
VSAVALGADPAAARLSVPRVYQIQPRAIASNGSEKLTGLDLRSPLDQNLLWLAILCNQIRPQAGQSADQDRRKR